MGESFGVSRTIARHALGQLAAEGLVDLRRNRIATVTAPTPADARDIFDIRVALERQVVQHLAGHLSPDQVATLKEIVRQDMMRATGRRRVDPAGNRVPHPPGRNDRQADSGPLCH